MAESTSMGTFVEIPKLMNCLILRLFLSFTLVFLGACSGSDSTFLPSKVDPVPPDDTPPASGLVAFADEMGSCILTDGSLVCWGENAYYQQLNGTTDNVLSPAPLSGFSTNVTSFDAGFNFACAVVDGGAKCWGGNDLGQLGDGTTVAKDTPVDVIGLTSGVTKVVAGWKHACALLTDGGVKCWGDNSHGELGRGFSDGVGGYRPTADSVVGFDSSVDDVATGSAKSEHTCAIVDGAALCWGYNSSGALGDGTKVSKNLPTPVTGLGTAGSGVLKIAPSRYSTCALLTGNIVKCWGDNDFGQLGIDSALPSNSTTPLQTSLSALDADESVVEIGTGEDHACLRTDKSNVYCWGRNSSGQLGSGILGGSNVQKPQLSLIVLEAQQLAVGRYHNCVITTDDQVKCWGSNNFGQLGQGVTGHSGTPLNVTLP